MKLPRKEGEKMIRLRLKLHGPEEFWLLLVVGFITGLCAAFLVQTNLHTSRPYTALALVVAGMIAASILHVLLHVQKKNLDRPHKIDQV